MNYLIGIVTLFLISAGAWLYGGPTKSQAPTHTTVLVPNTSAWVEVTAPNVTRTDSSGATTTLATGDEVAAGAVITTDAKGSALVHFPDGSFAKLDPSSSLTLTTIEYDESTGSSRVHLKLGVGTLWSKVLDLVGANSSWQVETSNAVATVRGTSFMTASYKGKTTIVGIEHSVAVAARALDTYLPLSSETSVTTNAELTIDDTHLAALAADTEKLATTSVSTEITSAAAYKAFKEREKKFDSLRDTLRAKYENDVEFHKAFREAELKDFSSIILDERKKSTEQSAPAASDTTTTSNTSATATVHTTSAVTSEAATTKPAATTGTTVTSSGGGSPTVSTDSSPHPVSLSVTTDADLVSGITDGDAIAFRAFLLYSDGAKKDVTSIVKWNVINKIGVFMAPGRFTAQLSAEYAELGEVSGAVYATYVGTDGKELNGATKVFVIHAYIPPLTSTDG